MGLARRRSDVEIAKTKEALAKLSSAELTTMLKEMPMADNNNVTNFSVPLERMTKTDLVEAINKMPEDQIKAVLAKHNIVVR
jgi:hypothetical protein